MHLLFPFAPLPPLRNELTTSPLFFSSHSLPLSSVLFSSYFLSCLQTAFKAACKDVYDKVKLNKLKSDTGGESE